MGLASEPNREHRGIARSHNTAVLRGFSVMGLRLSSLATTATQDATRRSWCDIIMTMFGEEVKYVPEGLTL
jgi:hypothetical protein